MVKTSSFFLIMLNHFITTSLLPSNLLDKTASFVVVVVSVKFISGSAILSNLLFLMCILSMCHAWQFVCSSYCIVSKYQSFSGFSAYTHIHLKTFGASSFVILFATCHELCTYILCAKCSVFLVYYSWYSLTFLPKKINLYILLIY